ncbi:hypothetical protein BGY98DRAFT_964046 [Russula aff. rugulosa BPL654]|nr:hypothetical protein BGY98DRAFT_964046 [Russula aff. rugulosa BPL654]
MAYMCFYCRRPFDKRKGLTIHQGKCPKRGRFRLRGPFTVQMSSDHSTSHTQAVTGPSLPIVQVDSLRLGMNSGLPSHRATPGASTDDGPNQLATPQPSAGGQSHSLHSHLVTEELSTGGPFLSEPSLEPEADAVTSLDLSQLRDPSLGDQPQSLVDHLPSEPTGLRRSTRSRIMTSRMRESISQQPSRKRRRIRP